MQRLLKTTCWVAVLGLLVPKAGAFALLGPPGVGGDGWQTAALAFQPLPGFDTLPEAPKNLGEEYRRNMPTLYYAFDANFLDYFGSNGVAAVEQAISVFNNLTNVSDYTTSLSEFPFSTKRENFRAELLGLTDLKSETMQLLIEQLGASDPERYTWIIHGRAVFTPPPCPGDVEYQIVQRNFDPVTYAPSSYVNGTLYSFVVLEFCTPLVPSGILADAAEFPVDPLASGWTAVAGLHGDMWGLTPNAGLFPGYFFTGLTRDDVGCLRYLWNTNNVNWESAGPGTLAYFTNTTQQILVTSNLSTFLSQAQTNDAATLQSLYPGLVITASSNWWGLGVTTNVTAAFVTRPQDPYGNPPSLVLVTNYTTNVVQYFHHTFLNVVTNSYSPYRLVTRRTITSSVPADSPYGTAPTLTTNSVTLVENAPSGDFYIIPTNLCGFDVITNLLPTPIVEVSTNIFVATNAAAFVTTNATTTITNNITGEVDIVTYYTNHTIVYRPVDCVPASTNLVQGIEHARFVRRDYDSLLGRFWAPVTNDYTLNVLTNGMVRPVHIRRVVTTPDILFSAQDGGGAGNVLVFTVSRTVTFNSANAGATLAGPGTIDPPTIIYYNKEGPVYEALTPDALNPFTAEASTLAFPLWIWGSFDGSTNTPIVYPDGTSIQNLENQLLLHPNIPTSVLPSATNGVPYSFQFTAAGGTPPYTWALSPTSPGLPPGLALSSSGTLSGIPSQSGTFDFVVRITDSETPTPRVVDWNYTMMIKPQ